MNSFALLINTFLFIGKAPVAPGTIGSIFALIIWWLCDPISITLAIIFLILRKRPDQIDSSQIFLSNSKLLATLMTYLLPNINFQFLLLLLLLEIIGI